MKGKRKVSPHVTAIADRCKGGQRLCKFLRQTGAGDTEAVFIFEPSGRRCAARWARAAIAAGAVRPAGDGLLGPSSSQSYVVA
ncbi:hypothetical protein ONR75_15760 [Rhodopseudomonas sp. P2A-2r]|uniref:hypothetical protein n=1 Tax=Rhodopseudomonas sp. P2A-2r TaxID=2991972 RepID=UPI0022346691|nr:hypothetical protein [Rhodopseudomonas sp. P2A-2r]UZE51887.1 hypothetical protein ONR75_15760 [Rhodopseudomonas sp. P2A-2r]